MEDPPDVAELTWRDGLLVKTWAQRGTLHLHRTDELPLWVGAQAALKPRYEQKTWLRHFKLTARGLRPHPARGPEGAARRAAQPRGAGRAGARWARPRLRRPAQAARVPRRADLHRGHEVRAAGAVRAAAGGGGHAGGRPPLPHPLRPRHARGPREVVRPPVARPGRQVDHRRGRDRVRVGAGRRTWRRWRRPSRPAPSGCCPRSTSTSSPRRATTGRHPRPSGSTAPAAGSRPSCSWTA